MTSQASRLLLVDDEPQLIRALKPALAAVGHAVESVDTGTAAVSAIAREAYDIVLLDLGLPDIDGKEVLQQVRRLSEVPIIVLSARDQELEKIAALDAGADDFVNKPFGMGELLARIRAAMRGRRRRQLEREEYTASDLRLNFTTRRVFIQGEEVRLTPREFDLMRALAAHGGRVVTHRQLMAAIWGPETRVDAQFVRVLVGQVRQKIEEDPASPRLILTEPGVGYRLLTEDET